MKALLVIDDARNGIIINRLLSDAADAAVIDVTGVWLLIVVTRP